MDRLPPPVVAHMASSPRRKRWLGFALVGAFFGGLFGVFGPKRTREENAHQLIHDGNGGDAERGEGQGDPLQPGHRQRIDSPR